jgi:hypothetical protein
MTAYDITDMDHFLSTDRAADAIRDSLGSLDSLEAKEWIEVALVEANGDAALVDWIRNKAMPGLFPARWKSAAQEAQVSTRRKD